MRVIPTAAGFSILLPINDFLFKLIFGDIRNKRVLKAFLQAFLGLPDHEFDVTIIDPALKRRIDDDKLSILDVRVKTRSGKEIDIEMQVARQAGLFERVCFYNDRMLVDQMTEGMVYEDLKKVISIVITDFMFIRDGNESRYHHCFRMMDGVDGALFGDVQEIHTIELPKLPAVSDGTAEWNWSKFIGVRTEEELRMLAVKDAALGQAVDVLYRVSADDEVRREYEAREKAWRDHQARLSFAYQEGVARERLNTQAVQRELEAALKRIKELGG